MVGGNKALLFNFEKEIHWNEWNLKLSFNGDTIQESSALFYG